MSRVAASNMTKKILALAGGVGGARLANGLAQILPPDAFTIVVNTGDDFEHLGLSVSPDLDTVMYTLAGINNPAQGWGVAGESWGFMDMVKRLGGESWFALGDHDTAVHALRTLRLRCETLSSITADFCERLGVRHGVAPMSDNSVRTMIDTDEGRLAFQDYFVRRQCAPRFRGIAFDGIEQARPSARFLEALADPALSAIIICPSNPILSIRPITSLPGITEQLRHRRVPVIAISPFIGGEAVKGPAAKIMRELDLPTTPEGLITYYDGLIDALVIDHQDAKFAERKSPVRTLVTDILIRDRADQARLAREVITFAQTLPAPSQDAAG